MIRAFSIVTLGLFLSETSVAQSQPPAFRIVTDSYDILTIDPPRPQGKLWVFHRYPDGALSSIRRTSDTEVRPMARVEHSEGWPSPGSFEMSTSEQVLVTEKAPGLLPGETLDLGETGSPRRTPVQPAVASRATGPRYVPRPGEGLPGKALFNPNRDYRPEWDSKLVPGYSMPFANSLNDYVEGKTLPYPPGNGSQQAPGYPPVLIYDREDAPRVLSRDGGWSPPVLGNSISPPTTAARGSDVPLVPDVHEVPHVGYDPSLPPPRQSDSPRQ
jgi:hypothetical protein